MHKQYPPPDFVIAGAPKCGTTALYEYLRDHPQVFMTTPKEPHYFAKDLYSPHYITEESKYLRLFDSAPKEAVRGEASVHYMFSNCALDNLLHHNPEIKIFILLRNPVELFRSWHAQLVYNGEEDIQDLEAAWGAQAARAEGRNLPVHLVLPNVRRNQDREEWINFINSIPGIISHFNLCSREFGIRPTA